MDYKIKLIIYNFLKLNLVLFFCSLLIIEQQLSNEAILFKNFEILLAHITYCFQTLPYYLL